MGACLSLVKTEEGNNERIEPFLTFSLERGEAIPAPLSALLPTGGVPPSPPPAEGTTTRSPLRPPLLANAKGLLEQPPPTTTAPLHLSQLLFPTEGSRPDETPPASPPPPLSPSPPTPVYTIPVVPWSSGYPTPSVEVETKLLKVLLKGAPAGWLRTEPANVFELPARRFEEISAACAALGVRVQQAASLRRAVLKNMHPSLFTTPIAQKAQDEAGVRFEDVVGAHLARHGVVFVTQGDQTRAWAALAATRPQGEMAPHPPATPDFLFPRGIRINGGEPIFWLEIKRFYGAGYTKHMRKWAPILKLHGQIEKYVRHYGARGAILFAEGFSSSLRGLLPETVLCLDGGDVQAALSAADAAAGNSFDVPPLGAAGDSGGGGGEL
jgi:hypothetical protein